MASRGLPRGRGMFPPGYQQGRGRGQRPPALTHHPHSHPAPYTPSEFPGAYPDVDSGEDDSGSPGERIPSPPPPQGRMMMPPPGALPPAGMAPMHMAPPGRGMWDNMAPPDPAVEGHELARPGWFGPSPQITQQLNQATETLRQRDAEILDLQHQMHEMFTSTSAEIASLKAKLKEATDKHGEETSKMKENINGLTEYIATTKAEDGIIDDAFFKEELSKFAQGMRNWVWKHCRAATLLPDMIEDDMVRTKIRYAVPEFSRLCISNSKITVIQAVVCDMLVRLVFTRYCVGLNERDEASLKALEGLLMSHAAGNVENEGPATLSSVNRWRALSISLLTSTEAIREHAESAIVDTTSDIETVVYSLIPPSKRPGEPASRQLIPLVSSAVRIAHMLKSQRARFEVVSPMNKVFDSEWMEDASGMEDDADSELRGKMVGAVAFPAVIKYGNERGEDYNKRVVIQRAKVLCLLDND